MPQQLPDTLAQLAKRQSDILSRDQLLAAGVTRHAIDWHTGRGWRLLLPGVVQVTSTPPTSQQRLIAALIFAGPTAVIGGLHAAHAYGIEHAVPVDPVDVIVPDCLSARHVGWLRVRRSILDDPAIVVRGPLRFSNAARAVLDAAVATGSHDTAAAIGIESVQRGVTTLQQLQHEYSLRNRRHLTLARTALDAAATGAWSVPEAHLATAISRSRLLPTPWLNPVLRSPGGERLTCPDLWFDDVALAVMVHSRRFHANPADWERTVAADARLVAAGAIVLQVTPQSIARELPTVLGRIEAAYRTGQARPRPVLFAAPRDVLRAG